MFDLEVKNIPAIEYFLLLANKIFLILATLIPKFVILLGMKVDKDKYHLEVVP